jgi:hypothetical protein
METGKAIFKLLQDSSAVGAICADRIYPELAQQDADVPFVVYTIADTEITATKNATSKLDTARVEVFCISDDYEQAMDLGIAVRGALDRVSGTFNGVQVQSIDIDTIDVEFDADQRVYILEQTYDVRIQRTGTAVSVANFPSNTFTVEEADGSPSGAVNKLVFSNGSLSIDGTTGTVTSGGGSSYYTLTSYFHNTDGVVNVYIPWEGTTENASLQYRHAFLCPFNGSLKKAYLWRQSGNNMTSGTIVLDFHRLSSVTASSSLESETITTPVNKGQSYNVSFNSSEVVAGFVYAMILRNDTDQNLGNVVVSLVFEVTSIA